MVKYIFINLYNYIIYIHWQLRLWREVVGFQIPIFPNSFNPIYKGDKSKFQRAVKIQTETLPEFGIEARMMEFIFYGNTKIEVWLNIIDFWAGKVTMFPCGGARFPNEDILPKQ